MAKLAVSILFPDIRTFPSVEQRSWAFSDTWWRNFSNVYRVSRFDNGRRAIRYERTRDWSLGFIPKWKQNLKTKIISSKFDGIRDGTLRNGAHKSRVSNGSGNSRRNSFIKPAISCAFVVESKIKLRLALTCSLS